MTANGYIAHTTTMNGASYALPTNPVQFDEQPVVPPGAPEHGQHTEELLMDAGHGLGHDHALQGEWGRAVNATSRAKSDSSVCFDPFSEEFFNGPFGIYRRMRDEMPVYYSHSGTSMR